MWTVCFIFGYAALVAVTDGLGQNVAVNQNTSQLENLDYNGFLWTSDRAVDNCTLQDDPNNQGCCSASTGSLYNFWRVDFDQIYTINSIVVYGRSADVPGQTEGFQVVIVSEGGMEELVYNNSGVSYGNGVFNIPLSDRRVASIVIIRPSGQILTLCEVQAFESESATTTTTVATAPVTMTTAVSSVASVTTPTTSGLTTRNSSNPTSSNTAQNSPTPTTGSSNGAAISGQRIFLSLSVIITVLVLLTI